MSRKPPLRIERVLCPESRCPECGIGGYCANRSHRACIEGCDHRIEIFEPVSPALYTADWIETEFSCDFVPLGNKMLERTEYYDANSAPRSP